MLLEEQKMAKSSTNNDALTGSRTVDAIPLMAMANRVTLSTDP